MVGHIERSEDAASIKCWTVDGHRLQDWTEDSRWQRLNECDKSDSHNTLAHEDDEN